MRDPGARADQWSQVRARLMVARQHLSRATHARDAAVPGSSDDHRAVQAVGNAWSTVKRLERRLAELTQARWPD